MAKKPKATKAAKADYEDTQPPEDEVDPVQAKYEAEALAPLRVSIAPAPEPAPLPPQPTARPAMPARFMNGGATAEERLAWEKAHGKAG